MGKLLATLLVAMALYIGAATILALHWPHTADYYRAR